MATVAAIYRIVPGYWGVLYGRIHQACFARNLVSSQRIVDIEGCEDLNGKKQSIRLITLITQHSWLYSSKCVRMAVFFFDL